MGNTANVGNAPMLEFQAELDLEFQAEHDSEIQAEHDCEVLAKENATHSEARLMQNETDIEAEPEAMDSQRSSLLETHQFVHSIFSMFSWCKRIAGTDIHSFLLYRKKCEALIRKYSPGIDVAHLTGNNIILVGKEPHKCIPLISARGAFDFSVKLIAGDKILDVKKKKDESVAPSSKLANKAAENTDTSNEQNIPIEVAAEVEGIDSVEPMESSKTAKSCGDVIDQSIFCQCSKKRNCEDTNKNKTCVFKNCNCRKKNQPCWTKCTCILCGNPNGKKTVEISKSIKSVKDPWPETRSPRKTVYNRTKGEDHLDTVGFQKKPGKWTDLETIALHIITEKVNEMKTDKLMDEFNKLAKICSQSKCVSCIRPRERSCIVSKRSYEQEQMDAFSKLYNVQ